MAASSMLAPILFTSLVLTWAAWWGSLHRRIRRDRAYARGRTATSTDASYRWLNPLIFLMPVGLATASFWTSSPALLPFHHSDVVRAVGAVLLGAGSSLYALALRHLGSNYSPCYDAHAPARLVRSGPYATIRHPMYAGKLIVGAATLLLSGSLWLVPTTLYLFAATLRAVLREDRALQTALPEYREYHGQTTMLVPGVL